MQQVNVKRLHDANRDVLALAWIAGRDADTVVRREPAASAALIGHLNLTHPNRIQVAGADEAGALEGLAEALFAAAPAAVIIADGIAPPAALRERAERTGTPLFATPLPATRVIEKLEESRLATDQTLEAIDGTWTRLRATVPHTRALEKFLLGYGSLCVVESPAELRASIAGELAKAAAAYGR